MAPKVLAFSGSARTGSFNRKLLALLVDATRSTGVEVTEIDLRDYRLPLYDGDLEEAEGLPEAAGNLRGLLGEHHALLIASPEYNSSITPLLKNTVDWCTRTPDAQPDVSLFTGKLAGLASTSPGAWGGIRGLAIVRSMFANIGVNVLGNAVAVPYCMQAFDEQGKLGNPQLAKWVESLGTELGEALKKLHGD